MKRRNVSLWAIAMVLLMVVSLLPTSTSAAGGEFLVMGNLSDGEGNGISGADVKVTDVDLNQFLTDSTDYFGDWEVDLDDLPGYWQAGDEIDIEIAINDQVIEYWKIYIDSGLNQLECFGHWVQAQTEPNCFWEWSNIVAGGLSSTTGKFNQVTRLKIGDQSNQVTLDTDMRFKDARNFQNKNPNCEYDMYFYISSGPRQLLQLYSNDHESAHVSDEYDDAPMDTGWEDVQLSFTIPQQVTDWYLTFVHTAKLQIPPFPPGTEWGGWTYSDKAQWRTVRIL